MLKKDRYISFFFKLKVGLYSSFYNYNVFFNKTNFLLFKYLNLTKKHKVYLFNLIYSYQLGYIFFQKNIFLKTLLKEFIKERKIFIVYTYNISNFFFFLKDLFSCYKNIIVLKKNFYKKLIQKSKLKKFEFNNFYKYKFRKIYNSKYFFTKNFKNSNFDINDIIYYFYDVFYPNEDSDKMKLKYKNNIIKKNIFFFFLKIKNNFISYYFFTKIYFYSNKIKFLNNFRNIIFYFLVLNMSFFRILLCEVNLTLLTSIYLRQILLK